MDPFTILSAFLPLVVQGGKAAINKWFGSENFKPATVEEYGIIKDKELQLFKAINEAGGNNPSYPWVEAVIRLQRPFVVICVLGTWAYAHYTGDLPQYIAAIDNAAAIISFYLFGERSMLYVNKKSA